MNSQRQLASGRHRYLTGVACVALTLLLAPASAEALAAPAEQSFNVPPASLESALLSFADQAGVQVIMHAQEVRGLRGNPVRGTMTASQALKAIIGNAPIVFEWTGPMTVSVRAASAQVHRVSMQVAPAPAAVTSTDPAPSTEPDEVGEIIVTARKREESFIDVPVVMNAVGGETLKDRGVTDLDGISRVIPQLQVGTSSGGVQGGVIVMRGIQGPSSNPQGDQAISFNVDGVQIAKASIRRLGMFDLAGVEVLKGPQALFYGKNSPGGIITLRTGDPTTEFKGSISGGYEFEAHEVRTEGYIAGPISDTAGFRLAGFYSRSRGFIKEQSPEGAYLAPPHDWTPRERSFGVRGTLKFEPTDRLSIRAKATYGEYKVNGLAATGQIIDCPGGAQLSQYGNVDDCKANGKNFAAGYGTVIGTQRPIFRTDGSPFSTQKQFLGGLEISYDVSDDINIASITGLYKTRYRNAANFTPTYRRALAAAQDLKNREFSQELRINTSFDGPLNLTAGFYLSDTKAFNTGNVASLSDNPAGPISQLNNNLIRQEGGAISGFAQLRYTPVEAIEISGGVRYSREKKKLPLVVSGGAGLLGPANALDPTNPAQIITPAVSKRTWKDWSPEVTISWKPKEDMNIFASYKHGFLSGGFNTSNTPLFNGVDTSYDPEIVEGFELGFKSYFFNRTLQLNLAAYTYKITDLQVATFINGVSRLTNAAGVRVKGAEADFTYKTPIDGLRLRGAVAYNKGRYTDYNTSACYRGQTSADGCTNVAAGTQDLGGTELVNAPKWNLSTGFDYDRPISDGLKIGLSAGLVYSSSYLTDPSSNPRGRMPRYTLIDASLRVGDIDDAWELALIGRNLSNKLIWTQSTVATFTGGNPGTGIYGNTYAAVGRGREVMVRATYNF